MRVVYLDASAAVKLFKEEPESAPLEAWLAGHGSALVLTSDLTRTELRRALHAAQARPDICRDAEDWLSDCALIRLTPALCDRAGELDPGTRLRSLDALHAAAALSLVPALVAFVAYDERLIEAAKQAGLPVTSPA
jgi:predicted nucleic acid-binding protein